jgi:hypothetical protein
MRRDRAPPRGTLKNRILGYGSLMVIDTLVPSERLPMFGPPLWLTPSALPVTVDKKVLDELFDTILPPPGNVCVMS